MVATLSSWSFVYLGGSRIWQEMRKRARAGEVWANRFLKSGSFVVFTQKQAESQGGRVAQQETRVTDGHTGKQGSHREGRARAKTARPNERKRVSVVGKKNVTRTGPSQPRAKGRESIVCKNTQKEAKERESSKTKEKCERREATHTAGGWMEIGWSSIKVQSRAPDPRERHCGRAGQQIQKDRSRRQDNQGAKTPASASCLQVECNKGLVEREPQPSDRRVGKRPGKVKEQGG